MEASSAGALSICIGGVGACKCEVPSCICNKSTTIPNKLCELHQCNIGHLDCDCTPPPAFFIFPSNQDARTRWVSLINREDLLINGSWFNAKDKHHVCWRHFPDGKPTNANPDPVQNVINGSPDHKADSDQDEMIDTSTKSEKEDILNSSFFNLSSESVENNKLNLTAVPEKENTPNASPNSERDNVNVSDSEQKNTQNMSADSAKDNTLNASLDSERDKTLNMSADPENDNTLNMSVDSEMDNTLNMSADSENHNTLKMSVDSERDNTLNTSADSENDNTLNTSADSERDNTLNKSAGSENDITLNTSADSENDNTLNTPASPSNTSNNTIPPSEKRQRKARNIKSKSKKVLIETESIEADSSETDSSSDSDDRVYCKCGKPNTDKMIGCDGKNCVFEWFHFKCIGIKSRKQVPRGKWYCDGCSKEVKDAQKDAMELKLKIKQICKDIMTKKTTIQSASETHGVSKAEITKQLYSEPILTTQEEERLVGLALSMAKQGRGVLVKRSILNNVKVLLDVEEKMGIKRLHPFEKNVPQDEWWHAFCKRHPQIKKMNLHKLPKITLLDKMKMLKQNKNPAPLGKKEKENTKNSPLVSKTSHPPIKSKLKRALSPQTNGRDHLKEDPNNDIKKLKCSQDATHDEKLLIVDNFEPNALHCLEAVLTKKQKHLFQYRFKNDIKQDDDVMYSAWMALKRLYYGTRDSKKDDTKKPLVPETEGDIPPWSPWIKGPFYVPDQSSQSSVSLLIEEPGKKRQKKMMSRIASMGVKKRGHYLEPWRFGVCNRKVFKPRKTQIKKRRRRKRRVTRRFEGYV